MVPPGERVKVHKRNRKELIYTMRVRKEDEEGTVLSKMDCLLPTS